MHYSSSTPELAGLQHVTEYLEFASGHQYRKRVFSFAPIVPILQLAKNCANDGSKFA